MTIDEFERQIKAEVENFFIRYRRQNKINPYTWPIDMAEGEWYDQIVNHILGV